ncbi:MAG: hypothetical protein JNM63_07290 [Spirochaetia bacterium]|nr:hypothetical protein [Spirochaetia bacterium]
MDSPKPHYLGWLLIGVFLIFGASMLAFSALTLSMPELRLAKLFWSLRPEAHSQLAALGKPLIFGFGLLAGVFAASATLWFRRRFAGWIMGISLIGVNVVGDIAQLFSGRIFEGSLGVVLGGALFLYMLSGKIRGNFTRKN